MRFQSTLPREERPLQHQLGLHRRIFQSTLPREERRAKRTCLPKEPSDFNPRSHERSDPQPTPLVCPPTFISIHAPTRGATKSTALLKLIRKISIHAPTRGATRTRKEFRLLVQNFNPRSHERSDNYQCSLLSHFSISIHAPTRGATNPLLVLCSSATIFQSTLPREERPSCFYRLRDRSRNFNPRSHERSDHDITYNRVLSDISIHAPTRGAT